jgi:predicted RNA-binding Zn-ribbon protein involved in translation (DUF1610 family)
MLVRCGRCRVELEVAGAGEFMCPRCGTRNVVKGPEAADPYGVPDLTIPGGAAPAPAAPPAEDVVRWVTCPECTYRFAAGKGAEEVTCPNCRASLSLGESEVRSAPSA